MGSSVQQAPNFNPRTPRGVRQSFSDRVTALIQISIHAPREGCDNQYLPPNNDGCIFQSTHPARGATISPIAGDVTTRISIHAPREGCDAGIVGANSGAICIFQSTHPARGATLRNTLEPVFTPFQSTHPARGATFPLHKYHAYGLFQSTHPARGATQLQRDAGPMQLQISIHAPREGCDDNTTTNAKWHNIFQSTHPARGATPGRCDCVLSGKYFNPRTPRGVRRARISPLRASPVFQSTHPARGATRSCNTL